jgi:CRISPR-associated protein Cmr6
MAKSKNLKDLLNKYLLPNDTAGILERTKLNFENFSLALNKFIRVASEEKIDIKSANQACQWDNRLLNNINQEIENAARKIHVDKLRIINAESDGRLIVGLGTESVYETSIMLHHVYGFPYIPGQGIKGAVRSHVIKEFFGSDESKALSEDKDFCLIFGCPEFADEKKTKKSALKAEHRGSIIFWDAFPLAINNHNISMDILNPHFGEYYENKNPPADYLTPVPVNFITLKDIEFRFIIGSDRKRPDAKELLNKAYNWTKEALENSGLGAKTAVGYGYFKIK